jgi:NAD-dependent SIR2 family protein deacetylase
LDPATQHEEEEEPSMAEAYCVKDKKKVEVQNPQKITMKNGKPAIQGTCPECGGKVFRIGG